MLWLLETVLKPQWEWMGELENTTKVHASLQLKQFSGPAADPRQTPLVLNRRCYIHVFSAWRKPGPLAPCSNQRSTGLLLRTCASARKTNLFAFWASALYELSYSDANFKMAAFDSHQCIVANTPAVPHVRTWTAVLTFFLKLLRDRIFCHKCFVHVTGMSNMCAFMVVLFFVAR